MEEDVKCRQRVVDMNPEQPTAMESCTAGFVATPAAGFKFDLRISAENASLLSGSIACPHCKRHGGQLKSQGAHQREALRR
jgi:hypothetical protein